MSDRHQRLVDEWVERYKEQFATWDMEAVGHYWFGWKDAVTFLWPDAETFMAQDPQATEYVCRTLAIERIFRRKSSER